MSHIDFEEILESEPQTSHPEYTDVAIVIGIVFFLFKFLVSLKHKA